MGSLIQETKTSTQALIARRNAALKWRANLPETLWRTIFELLSPENAKALREELKQMRIQEGISKIVNLQNDDQWELQTCHGNKPYLLIGNGNFRIYGTENDIPNSLFISTGDLPNDAEIYDDEYHYSSVMVAFPESHVRKYTIQEIDY